MSAITFGSLWHISSGQQNAMQTALLVEHLRAQPHAVSTLPLPASGSPAAQQLAASTARLDTVLSLLRDGGSVSTRGANISGETNADLFLPAASAELAARLNTVRDAVRPYKTAVGTLTAAQSGQQPDEEPLRGAAARLDKELAATSALLQSQAMSDAAMLPVAGGICLLVSALLMVLSYFWLRSTLLRPLTTLRNYLHHIACEEQKDMVCDEQDIGTNVTYSPELQMLRDDMTTLVRTLREKILAADTSESEAHARAEETASALKNAEKEHAAIQKLYETMSAVANRAQGVSQRVFASVEELSHQIEIVNHGVDVQRDRMTETATAMEEMNSTVLEVARNATSAAQSASSSRENAVTGAAGVRDAVTSIENIRGRILALKESMGQLGRQADSISQIMTTISDIADQTNLLALNAAIEAARAGDAGRGFAVVADEVRKLAEKTMHATRDVGEAVQRIQTHAHENVQAVEQAAQDIESSTQSAAHSGEFMDNIVQIVEETAMQVSSIAAASDQQSAASEQINRAVLEVTKVASDTAEGMTVSARALVEISSLVEELDTVIQSLASGKATGVNAAAGEELFTWTDDLALGIPSIDAQHKRLVELINMLHTAMKQRSGKDALVRVVEELKKYTVTHFKYEEDLFDKHHYPETKGHVVQHEKFVETVLDFEEGLRSGKVTVTMDVMRFLKDWLMKHINGTDRLYSHFLQERGVR